MCCDAPAAATTHTYTLSLHDALPISTASVTLSIGANPGGSTLAGTTTIAAVSGVATFSNLSLGDRKSTRLNSSHVKISYAVFCLKKDTSHAAEREKVLKVPSISIDLR